MQDPDGAHIAGELINYFTIMFPTLLRAKPDFLMRLGTPIVRLKPKNKGERAISFFTTSAFRTWLQKSGLPLMTLVDAQRGICTRLQAHALSFLGNMRLHTLVAKNYTAHTHVGLGRNDGFATWPKV